MIEGNGPNFVMAETSKLQFPLKDIINTMGRIIQRAIKEEKKKTTFLGTLNQKKVKEKEEKS